MDKVSSIQKIIGSSWWITVQMLYLMGKFSGENCVFLPISFDPVDEKQYKSQTEMSAMFSLIWECQESKCQFVVPPIMSSSDFITYLKECINESSKLSIIPLKLFSSDGTGHANMLIYDKVKNTLERFEPHGQISLPQFNPSLLDRSLPVFFEKNILGKPVTYFSPEVFCPREGPQLLEEIARKDLGISFLPKTGLCSVWSFIYAIFRLSYPHKSREQIVADILSRISTDKTMYHFAEKIILMLYNLSEKIRYAKTHDEIGSVINEAVISLQ